MGMELFVFEQFVERPERHVLHESAAEIETDPIRLMRLDVLVELVE